MHIIGIILIAAGAGLLLARRSTAKKLAALSRTETFTAKTLGELHAASVRDLGQGKFRYAAEVKGLVACADPLTSMFAKEKCVAYQNEVVWEYEETVWEEDAQTRQRRSRRVRKTETISRSERAVPFEVEDETGRVKVDPEGADIDWPPGVDRFEPEAAAAFSEGRITLGGFAFQLLSGFSISHEGRRTLGYRYRERTFPVGRFAFVLGEASDARGELTLGQPTLPGGCFLITAKSEEELAAKTRRDILLLGIGAGVSLLAGVVLLALKLFI
ncbi:MAG: E3 ubiquitin ligase family protein [Elusimicrobia bacterium]|nr:E3 ubiquitin ligase family protein [Elusimicrobiota bacterium]